MTRVNGVGGHYSSGYVVVDGRLGVEVAPRLHYHLARAQRRPLTNQLYSSVSRYSTYFSNSYRTGPGQANRGDQQGCWACSTGLSILLCPTDSSVAGFHRLWLQRLEGREM